MPEENVEFPTSEAVFETYAARKVTLETCVEYLVAANRTDEAEGWAAVTFGIVIGTIVAKFTQVEIGIFVAVMLSVVVYSTLVRRRRREIRRIATHFYREQSIKAG